MATKLLRLLSDKKKMDTGIAGMIISLSYTTLLFGHIFQLRNHNSSCLIHLMLAMVTNLVNNTTFCVFSSVLRFVYLQSRPYFT